MTYFRLNWFPTLQSDVLHLAVVTDNGKVLSRDLSSCGEKHNLNIKNDPNIRSHRLAYYWILFKSELYWLYETLYSQDDVQKCA